MMWEDRWYEWSSTVKGGNLPRQKATAMWWEYGGGGREEFEEGGGGSKELE